MISLCNSSLSARNISLSTCESLIYNGDPKKKIDLTFVGLNYTSLEKIKADINQNLYTNVTVPSAGLFEVEPFKSNQNKFNVYALNNTCLNLTDIYENTTRFINEVAAACPNTNQIVVIVNDNGIPALDNSSEIVGGWAYPADNSSIGFAITFSKGDGTAITHEFGHSFGGLCDEYSYQGNFTQPLLDQNVDCPNCAAIFSGNENISCPKWKDISGTGCYQGCEYENLYRSEPFSIMGFPDIVLYNVSNNRSKAYAFDQVSKIAIENKLNKYS